MAGSDPHVFSTFTYRWSTRRISDCHYSCTPYVAVIP